MKINNIGSFTFSSESKAKNKSLVFGSANNCSILKTSKADAFLVGTKKVKSILEYYSDTSVALVKFKHKFKKGKEACTVAYSKIGKLKSITPFVPKEEVVEKPVMPVGVPIYSKNKKRLAGFKIVDNDNQVQKVVYFHKGTQVPKVVYEKDEQKKLTRVHYNLDGTIAK